MSESLNRVHSKRVMIDGLMTGLAQAPDRVSNKLIKKGVREQTEMWILSQALTPKGQVPKPPRSLSVKWAQEALLSIPPRLVVRA